MTYLDWGCDPLTAECGSCLDAICNSCSDAARNRGRGREDPDGMDDPDLFEPDCDRCDREKKADCTHCEIIIQVCRDCPENPGCEFKISP
jgi:hypothetical protein